MDLTFWLLILVVLILVVVVFLRHMTATHDTFKKMGVDTPPTSMLLGHFGDTMRLGIFDSQMKFYNQFKDKKAYGVFDARLPILVIKDLDMIKDVLVKNFNHFANRRPFSQLLDPPFTDSLLFLNNEEWKRVRSAVSPTFSSGRIKRMSKYIERSSKKLMTTLQEKCEKNEDVEFCDLSYDYALSVIASAVFGVDINPTEEQNHAFVIHAKKIVNGSPTLFFLGLVFPRLVKFLGKLGFPFMPQDSLDYFTKLVDSAISCRKEEGLAGKANDFIDLVINAERETDEPEAGQLKRTEIHGQAFVFFFAAYDTVATVLSFTLFLLANNPECRQKLLEEIDQHLGKEAPNYDNVQNMAYLDMCINESMRLYPPGVFTDRICTEDVTIEGVSVPKDMIVMMPFYAIHNDPDIFPEPEKFQPERFTPENKAARHSYAHLPFGQGPRNCIGMRLGLLELKVAIAAILQQFDLLPCSKTVYPSKLMKFLLRAENGLWVKLEARK